VINVLLFALSDGKLDAACLRFGFGCPVIVEGVDPLSRQLWIRLMKRSPVCAPLSVW
jgi:hypothetical protein